MSKFGPKYQRKESKLDTTPINRSAKGTKKKRNEDAEIYLPRITMKTQANIEPEYELAPDRWSPSGWKYKPRLSRNLQQTIRTQADYFIRDVNQQLSSFKTRNYSWVNMLHNTRTQ